MHHSARLEDVLSRPGSIVHLAHHVQYFQKATKDHHNPSKADPARIILRLTKTFNEYGIPTAATILIDRMHPAYEDEKKAQLHPYLRSHAHEKRFSTESSPYRDEWYGVPKLVRGRNIVVLTGYNSGKCYFDTGMDIVRSGTLVLPVDGTENYYRDEPGTGLTKQEALEKLEQNGAVLCQSSDIVAILARKHQPKPPA